MLVQDLITKIEYSQIQFLWGKKISDRKLLGQYFTEKNVANYMASLIKKPKSDSVRILDAGAGSGILTVSTALQCLNFGIKNVHAVMYEIDESVVELIQFNMALVETCFKRLGANFTYDIFIEDFILARPDKSIELPFDISVINPPYFKYNVKNSSYSKILADLYKGDPNVYASFMAIVCACLADNGQMISITPRSFTNGLYFKGFRSFLLNESDLDLIHIFKSRNKVFDSVLQENIICRFIKSNESKYVEIRSSDCDNEIYEAEINVYPKSLIIDKRGGLNIVRIPESASEAKIMLQAEKFEKTFEEEGYFISTGPVVEHRTRDFILEGKMLNNSVPLYRPHNVTPLNANVSFNEKKDASFMLAIGHKKHTIRNDNYVLLKRMSSKDEKRRLIAAVHFADTCNKEFIAFGNKLNYIGVVGEKLSEDEAYGLAAVLNSTFFDKYFRCISGNTQVNATEIRTLKFPTRQQIKSIGLTVMNSGFCDSEKIDAIVNPVIGINIFE